MKPIYFILLFLAISFSGFSQPFAIGYTDVTFEDANRSNRQIPVQIHYPAMVAAEDVAVEGTDLPVIAVGHGFVMGVASYLNIVNTVVPEGYIVVLVDTETGFSPDHETFGLDLEFVVAEMQSLGVNPSIFQGKIGPNAALIGHSMGGGASFLAAPTANITCMVTMAPAETNPSAIAAAANITIPSLIFAAEDDCVASIADHQQPLYDALASDCKTMVVALGGSHCKFAETNIPCSTGELLCMGSITRADQHVILFDYLLPYFDNYLRGNAAGLTQFNSLLMSDSRIDYQQSCSGTSLVEVDELLKPTAFPNPANNVLNVLWEAATEITRVRIVDFTGKVVLQQETMLKTTDIKLNVAHLSEGIYLIEVHSKDGVGTSKFIKN